MHLTTAFALAPLIPPLMLLAPLVDLDSLGGSFGGESLSVSVQLMVFLVMAAVAYLLTIKMVPSIRDYTLRAGISGKDLGKKGTALADKDV